LHYQRVHQGWWWSVEDFLRSTGRVPT
jgi:hypothetical protein